MTKVRTSNIVAIVVAVALLVAMLPTVVLAAEDDSISGQFTLGNDAPSVTSIGLYESDNSTAATSMTPQTEYILKVAVTDTNTLDDLDTVEVTIFYDEDGDDDSGDIPADNTTVAATMTCTVGATPSWSINPSSSTTWDIVEASCEQPTLTGSSGTFCFRFTPGKVATEAADWDAYAVATDDSALTDDLYDGSDYDMNWYGEIATSASVDWGTVTAGSDFSANKQTGISINYIANGAYDEQVAASTPWGAAALDIAGNPDSNEFSLRANDEDSEAGWVDVATTAAYATMDDSGTQTAEAGDDVTGNTLWLKLGTPFTDNTYSGTIYFRIANGS